MARSLFRVASDPPPSEPDPGARLICDGGWGSKKCGLPKGWGVEPCVREGCPGNWAWRCPTGRHGDIDDALELAAHGLSHDTRAREILVEGLHSCSRCGGRDWETAGGWALDWKAGGDLAPSDLQTLKFVCRGCGYAVPVHEFILYSLEGAYRELEAVRPGRWDPIRPCPCGRSKMQPDTDWIGPECACCGGVIYHDVANWARPLCTSCDGRTTPTRPPGLAPPQSPGTAAWAW
jgi:hypothetical protein